LVDFALQLRPASLPQECLAAAKRCFLDYFAVALAGSRDPISMILEQYLAEHKGASSVIGSPLETSLEGAAFANGSLGHVLDYDDVKARLGHGTVVIAPAVLALGEKLKKSGLDVITAFVAGFEISSRIANSIEPSHSQHGWHTMSTCGIFGAVAACAWLLRLNKHSFVGAFGIAGSFSSGLRINMGTPAKAIHAGQTAQNGLKAAILASLGVHGTSNIFSERKAFGDLFSSDPNPTELTLGLGEAFEILNNGFKLYPCCASSHTAIDAVLALRKQHHFNPEDIEEIRVGTVPLVLDNLIYNIPKNVVECRFSMPFCLSLAVMDGEVTLNNFSETRLEDPELMSLMGKVSVYADPEMEQLGYRGTENANVTITTEHGARFSKRVDIARGHALNPITDDELHKKFRICAGRAISENAVDKILYLLTTLEKLKDISELFALR
jgi:2-methylcitrate dehydratase PrpD